MSVRKKESFSSSSCARLFFWPRRAATLYSHVPADVRRQRSVGDHPGRDVCLCGYSVACAEHRRRMLVSIGVCRVLSVLCGAGAVTWVVWQVERESEAGW